ncbi:unnamed protein product [Musa banksii]
MKNTPAQFPPTYQHPDARLAPQSPPRHAVRKPATKPWRKPVLPPPRVYRADARSFRQLVQRLTGAPRQQTSRPPHEDAGPTARVLPPSAFVPDVIECTAGGAFPDLEIAVPARQSAMADPGLPEFFSSSSYSPYIDLEFFPSVESGDSSINGGLQ